MLSGMNTGRRRDITTKRSRCRIQRLLDLSPDKEEPKGKFLVSSTSSTELVRFLSVPLNYSTYGHPITYKTVWRSTDGRLVSFARGNLYLRAQGRSLRVSKLNPPQFCSHIFNYRITRSGE